MSMVEKRLEEKIKDGITDEEIHSLAEWLQGMSLREMFYLRDVYLNLLEVKAMERFGFSVH